VIVRWFVVLLFLALRADAAVTLSPSSPSAGDVITARIEYPSGCSITTQTTIAGSVVRTDVTFLACSAGPPPVPVVREVTFGPLPAGAYVYEVYFVDEGFPPALEAQLAFLVQPVAVPALSESTLLLLVVAMTLASLVVLRR
jgi:hypothetical protein